MNKLYFNFICALTLSVVSFPTYAKITDYDITCGIAKESNNIFSIIKVGTDIPYITRQTDPDFYFGCIISASKTGFTMHHLITVPKPKSKIINTNLDLTTKEIKADKLVIKSAPESYEKFAYVVMNLDDGDSAGLYNIDIYINNSLIKKVAFNISKKSYNKSLKTDASQKTRSAP